METELRIGISGYFLDKPTTGTGQYSYNLLRELLAIAEEEIVIFCSPGGMPRARELIGQPAKASLVPIDHPGGNLGKVWFEQVGIVLACRRHKVDLLHVPYFGSPLIPPAKTVVTIHDLIMLLLPPYRGSLLVRLYTALVSAAAKRAKLVIADSQCTRADIVKKLGIPQEGIRVIYLACEDRFQPIQDRSQLDHVRHKYQLGDRFILYLGGLDWRKNLARLIRAAAAQDTELVITGEAPFKKGRLFPNLDLVAQTYPGRIRFLGWVNEEDKPALYSLAHTFIYPSLYEGFGLPPLEAMACGTPVLCSRASSLPEVVGEAAILFDPEDEGEMRHSLALLLTDEGRRRELRERGLRRARSFSWRRTAQETLDAYRQALSLRGQPEGGVEKGGTLASYDS